MLSNFTAAQSHFCCKLFRYLCLGSGLIKCANWKMSLVLTRLKSHCGPGVRKVKELPLRSDLYDKNKEDHMGESEFQQSYTKNKITKSTEPVYHSLSMWFERGLNFKRSSHCAVNKHYSDPVMRIFKNHQTEVNHQSSPPCAKVPEKE